MPAPLTTIRTPINRKERDRPTFERLSEKLELVFKKLRGHGSLSPELIAATLREIRMALLEAEVTFKVTKGP